ncbi:unnamed protein product [Polarella glacialis]|uniref:ATP-dependent transporter ycf16 n=1 Tax=Polarella glacialis TaxID=89957 RepID=A0A813EC71_POLGL|nr:unnamed protein product [Polarella glacialis]
MARLVRGRSKMLGTAAYVPQNPQILNASLRENVLFGLPLEETRYRQALRACCLEPDLAQLTDGDATEIGEKGITISGGQRARVALARVYYANPDVVVLDDPLSAMDAHVGAEVFRNCILALRDQGKAVLLMTNQLQLCCAADRILVLDLGRVTEQGSFSELSGRQHGHLGGLLANPDTAAGNNNNNKKNSLQHDASGSASEPGKSAPAGPDLEQAPAKTRTAGMTSEAVLQGRVGLREWQRIAKSAHSRVLGAVLLASCLVVPIFMYASPVLLGLWTSAAREGGDPVAAGNALALYVAAGGLVAAGVAARVSTAALYFARVSGQLHRRMLASVLRQPLVWYDTTPLGRVLNRFSQDVALMDLQLPRLFEFTLQHTSVVLVGVIGAGALAWPVLLVMLPVLWPLRHLQMRYGAVALHLQRLMLNATSPVMSKASGFLTALDTIRAFGREDLFAADFRVAMGDFCRAYYWIHATDRLGVSLLTVLCIPSLTLLMGVSVLILARAGLLTPELGGMALALSAGFAQRIPLFLWCSSTLEKFFGGVQRVAEYADLPWEGGLCDHAAWVRSSSADGLEAPSSELAKVSDFPALELIDIHLRYQPNLPPVLKGLSLTVWAGEKLAVCGRTGSGKSTLFLACFRMIEPESGQIFLEGRDALCVPLPQLRSELAIVPQDPLMLGCS